MFNEWWNSDSGGKEHFSLGIAYDESSNITRTIDNIQIDPGAGGSGSPGTHAFDAAYTIDGLNRVTRAHEGKWDTSSITTQYRDEQWTLTQTGNWDRNKVNLNSDADFTDTGEHDDTRTHAPVNEILTRNTDSAGGAEFTLVYNLRGDLEDEGGTGGYKYVYDAFGRLVEVRRQNNSLLAAYRYNGLNQRITWHYDATGNGTTDGSDPVYHFCYDDKWRIVGTWRGTDSEPKELFVYHQAGLAGMGGSSYIDSVAFRDRDMTNGWTGSADGTREQRHYYAQNWRADVSAIFDNAGAVMEWQKYSAYGVPYLITPGDHNKDGVVNSADVDAFDEDYKDGVVSRADLNKDGVVDSDDETLFTASYAKATVGGRWKLSGTSIGSRKGYAGYEHDGFGHDMAVPELAHVRNRVLHFEMGRWTRRDPLGYVDGINLAESFRSSPIALHDVDGQVIQCTAQVQQLCLAQSIAMGLGSLPPCLAARRLLALLPQCHCALWVVIGLEAQALARCFTSVLPGANSVTTTFVLSAAVGLTVANHACPPCPPGVSRFDQSPPSAPHWPCPGDHWHISWNTGQAPWPSCRCSYASGVWCLPDGPWVPG